MQTDERQARRRAMQLVGKVELTRHVRNGFRRMVAGWPDPATLPVDEREAQAWQQTHAQDQIARLDAEIADLERELALLPQQLREQGLAFRLGMRFFARRGPRVHRAAATILLAFSRGLLQLVRILPRRRW